MEKGRLVRWNTDKGFGFIKPDTENSKDVFIHISILKHMTRQPIVGDQINYFAETQSDGKVKAIKANIEGVAVMSARKPNIRHHSKGNKKSTSSIFITILIILGIGIFAFQKFNEHSATPIITNKDVEHIPFEPVQTFRCETGKTHCSHMRSCEEATFYINNCPNTKMDGDNDGVPCEMQWCN